MTDKELVELAAKATGIVEDSRGGKADPRLGIIIETRKEFSGDDYHRFPSRYWNPLKDDGDALRLAVKLDITVSPRKTTWQFGKMVISHEYLNEEDAFAATRRAIVRAAVEIGKGMK